MLQFMRMLGRFRSASNCLQQWSGLLLCMKLFAPLRSLIETGNNRCNVSWADVLHVLTTMSLS